MISTVAAFGVVGVAAAAVELDGELELDDLAGRAKPTATWSPALSAEAVTFESAS
jgi:hypothetical protein